MQNSKVSLKLAAFCDFWFFRAIFACFCLFLLVFRLFSAIFRDFFDRPTRQKTLSAVWPPCGIFSKGGVNRTLRARKTKIRRLLGTRCGRTWRNLAVFGAQNGPKWRKRGKKRAPAPAPHPARRPPRKIAKINFNDSGASIFIDLVTLCAFREGISDCR